MKSDKDFLRTHQYNNPEGFLSRMNILNFGDNRENFWEWVAKHYDISKAEKILEVGCGTGDFWQFMKSKLHAKQQLTLTDFSDGMLQVAEEHVKKFNLPCKVNFQIADVEDLPFPDQSFNVVLAHLMLYHATSQQKALAEINRVLQPGGWVGISTFALENFHAMLQLAHEIDNRIPPYTVTFPFTEEKADRLLKEYFPNIKKYRFLSHLNITELEPLLNLIRNYTTIKPFNLPESFFQQYAAKAQEIIKEQEGFKDIFNMVLYICFPE